MKNKIVILFIATIISLISNSAFADHRHDPQAGGNYFAMAKVIWVEPVYRQVEIQQPRNVCHNEVVSYEHRPNPGGALIAGGIVGGVIGSELGRGHKDRHLATAVGTLIGAAVGQDAARHPAYVSTAVERHCTRVVDIDHEQRIGAYRVGYRYHGRHYTTRMDRDPGPRIRIQVQVAPVHY